ncbi:TetR/AcrR family transcriptional regulator [Streptomyces sp. NBC_01020]|uniref:TetR/AcrR family transcriptional regulator n=1 Tax=unclassified Streptomyces TaxID=2593676 RepID=UPI002E246403|nr:TetR/AcrR family transcriptional regulator [Streptomyces sp. NBC_01020]WSX66704.1 TetR/AcrR family transcriptional regulator [Streptomyces sp. NBC_00932]
MSSRSPRGPYRKTVARREQIIDAALAAYTEAGSRGVSVRDIAQRVGMTDAGVMHHFGSREELFTAVLQAREKADRTAFGDAGSDPKAAFELLAHNATTPGLVKLFLDVAAAAAEPDHPAHAYFTERYPRLRESLGSLLTDGVEHRQDLGAERSTPDADWAARILLAAVDGLQLQWLLDPDIDMAADMATLSEVLLGVVAADGGQVQRTVSDDAPTTGT